MFISCAITIFIMFLMVFIRVFYGCITEFKKAEKSFQDKNYKDAIMYYDAAIHWYTPFNKYVARSAERLWETGGILEAQGDNRLAIEAYRAIRSSFYAARSFYTPYPGWIKRCDDKISTMMAREEPTCEEDKHRTFEERKTEHLSFLHKDYAPDVFWSMFLEFGFIGWITCTILFIFRVFEGEKGFHNQRALFWGSFIILFYGMWIVGMMKA
ncbi:MAG: hypothetical protein V1872_14070 [bacterium]